jgi:hypothetical protein
MSYRYRVQFWNRKNHKQVESREFKHHYYIEALQHANSCPSDCYATIIDNFLDMARRLEGCDGMQAHIAAVARKRINKRGAV